MYQVSITPHGLIEIVIMDVTTDLNDDEFLCYAERVDPGNGECPVYSCIDCTWCVTFIVF